MVRLPPWFRRGKNNRTAGTLERIFSVQEETVATKTQQIIGNSASLRATLASARKVARSSLSVLVTGESGTGKELFARFIHDESSRSKGPFVAVNCAAIPGELLEAELFGHKKGAFSGAVNDRDGLFVQAHGGTLFLDEIGDMPLPLQAKILRVLQEGEVRPVGARTVQKVDVRIVSATHRDLAEMAREKKFRDDLIFRLRGYALRLPPLRERERDVVTLAQVFLKSQKEFSGKGLSRDLQELLTTYAWPGNIRELQNAILAAAVDAPRNIGAEHLRRHLSGGGDLPKVTGTPLEKRLLTALEAGGKMTLAQMHADLHVPKPTLHRHLGKMVANGKAQRLEVTGLVVYSLPVLEIKDMDARLTPRQEKGVILAREKGRITRQGLSDALGVSIRTASRDLAEMTKNGLLEPNGVLGRFAGYTIPNQAR
ncbi:MAG: sigma 54-interacting transcriptional regulator [Magnetococcales bacterium]|nr:sigma 54-interacting transcriptional regulator [Magnetococcales bacterium]